MISMEPMTPKTELSGHHMKIFRRIWQTNQVTVQITDDLRYRKTNLRRWKLDIAKFSHVWTPVDVLDGAGWVVGPHRRPTLSPLYRSCSLRTSNGRFLAYLSHLLTAVSCDQPSQRSFSVLYACILPVWAQFLGTTS